MCKRCREDLEQYTHSNLYSTHEKIVQPSMHTESCSAVDVLMPCPCSTAQVCYDAVALSRDRYLVITGCDGADREEEEQSRRSTFDQASLRLRRVHPSA